MRFNGTCDNFTTVSEVCGDGAIAEPLPGMGYYRCQCPANKPFAMYHSATASDPEYYSGCTASCAGGKPASDGLCPKPDAPKCATVNIEAGKCLCYFDGGYRNYDGECKLCDSHGTPFVTLSHTEC